MRLVPKGRLSWGIVGVLGVLLVSFPLWRSPVRDLVNGIRTDRDYDDAAGRNSDPAPVGAALPLPELAGASGEPGTDPAILLRQVAALAAPSSVADPPGPGPVLVTTLEGRLHQLDVGTGATEVVLDLSRLVSTGGERGLLGAAVDPDGDRLYLDYTNVDGDTEIRSWSLGDDGRPVGGADDGVLHLRIGQPFTNHNGGNLVFGPDGALWIGTGDGGSAGDPGDVAQDPDSILGKILRVIPRPEGGVEAPSTNPAWGGRPEVWGIGLRNPWRYSFDRATNALWIADVGQDRIEEVSEVAPTEPMPDFGWNEVEGLEPFDGVLSPEQVQPVITYPRADGCSVTGGYVYRGVAIPGLYGWYVYGDYCSGWVRAARAHDPGQGSVELLSEIGQVISFAELDDGELLVLTADAISAIEPE
jgi:glucose/arabinose dehydrogenase